ncbi:MAG: YcxB family protein [Sphingomonadales bacterium]|nr:YcxB family protein [Sphingomonadales bacterium]
MSGQFTFGLSKQDFVSAYYLYLRHVWLWKKLVLAYLLATVAYAALIVGIDAFDTGLRAAALGEQIATAAGYSALLAPILVVITIVGSRIRLGRMYDQLGVAGRDTTFLFDPEGLQTSNRDATTTYRWDRFRQRIENERYILLCFAQGIYIIVVKKAVEPAMLSRFISALNQSGISDTRT